MATKESIQRRELVAREILAASLERLGIALGLDLPAPAAEPATDPAFRSMTHLESLAGLLQRVADEAQVKLAAATENMRSEPPEGPPARETDQSGVQAQPEAKRPGRPRRKL